MHLDPNHLPRSTAVWTRATGLTVAAAVVIGWTVTATRGGLLSSAGAMASPGILAMGFAVMTLVAARAGIGHVTGWLQQATRGEALSAEAVRRAGRWCWWARLLVGAGTILGVLLGYAVATTSIGIADECTPSGLADHSLECTVFPVTGTICVSIAVVVGLLLARIRALSRVLASAGSVERPAQSQAGRSLLFGDRGWWWDGGRWIDGASQPPTWALRSPDGRFWWDGGRWYPVIPTPVTAPQRSS